MSPSKAARVASRLAVVCALLVASSILAACSESEPEPLRGMVRTPLANVGHVVLPNASDGGAEFTTKAEPGRLLVVYFGYTSCPDICPTTMADLRRAMREMDHGADLIDVAFITVDPNRDVPDKLTAYIRNFFPTAVGLRTEDDSVLSGAAQDFGAAYEVVAADDGTVEVAHSAFLYAIDSDGTILVQWPFGMRSDDIGSDLQQLVDAAT